MSFCMGNTCGSTAGLCSYRKGFKPEERIMLTVKMMPKVFIESFKNKDIELRAVDNLPCEDILTCFFYDFLSEQFTVLFSVIVKNLIKLIRVWFMERCYATWKRTR